MTPLAGEDTLIGRRGELRLAAQIEQVDVGDGYGTDTGTWSINIYATKGVYRGYTGGGRLSGVRRLQERRAVIRLEGFVTRG